MPIDITDVTFEAFEVKGADAGYIITPPSDTKQTYIPSPPSFVDVKINPRPGTILFTPEPITADSPQLDSLKAAAKEEKLFIVCPKAFDNDSLMDIFDWLNENVKARNILPEDVRIAYLQQSADAALAFIKAADEEYGETFGDAECLSYNVI